MAIAVRFDCATIFQVYINTYFTVNFKIIVTLKITSW